MIKIKEVTCDNCNHTFSYTTKDLISIPQTITKNILGEQFNKDFFRGVCCPNCNTDILTYDTLDVTGNFKD